MIYAFKIFRFDPQGDPEPREQEFRIEMEKSRKATVLDALFEIQQTQDRTLSFRYCCRVAMCGSCALAINGREGLACKTLLRDLPASPVSLRPLRHFPIQKDLVVELKFMMERFKQVVPYFIPRSASTEPARIRPESKERTVIGLNTECIACGSCLSACTMMHWDPEYLGPMALNRAFCLIADSRDGSASDPRLPKIAHEHGIYRCRQQFNCSEVCPKNISPARGIQHLKRQALIWALRGLNPLRSGEKNKSRLDGEQP